MPTSTAATVTRASSPGCEPGDLDRQGQRAGAAASAPAASSSTLSVRAAAVDLEPGEPERAAGHALRRLVERPVRERDEIGAGAPLRLDRDRHRRAVGGDVDDAAGRAPCRRRPRGSPCRRSAATSRALDRLARAVARLVERHVEEVGRVGGLVAGPADRERHARLRASRRRRRARPAGSVPHSTGAAMRAGASAATSMRPVGDAPRRLHRLEAPAAVAVEPLVAALDPEEVPGHALARQARAVGGRAARRRRSRSRPRRGRRRSSCARRPPAPSAGSAA